MSGLGRTDHARAPAALVTKIRAHLHEFQGADGAWGYNAATPADDLQSTAHAVEALSLTAGRDVLARLQALRGAGWLVKKQAANGGWEVGADRARRHDARRSIEVTTSGSRSFAPLQGTKLRIAV